mmetsp:Transcript_85554/g.228872  ORF Transcript_85554/g.228872 Transcript_85554/m.228872 type:complete len:245 (-) Transcript_85554:129-863(-)
MLCSVSVAHGDTVQITPSSAVLWVNPSAISFVRAEFRNGTTVAVPGRLLSQTARMHSLSTWRDALIWAPSCWRSLLWYMLSLLRSVPARSQSMSRPERPPVCSLNMKTACDRLEVSFAPVTSVCRRAWALRISRLSWSADSMGTSATPSRMKWESLSARSAISGFPCCSRSHTRFPTTSKKDTVTEAPASNSCWAVRSSTPVRVWVLPLPVCPNMNRVATPPFRAWSTRGAEEPAWTSSVVTSS